MRQATRNCPICSEKNIVQLHTQKFELPIGHPLANGYDIVSCLACGFVYADTKINQADYDRFYAEHSKYEDKKTGTGGTENDWDRKRLEDTAGQIASYLNDPSTKIIDVGCANGGLLKALINIGYHNVLGIDPSPLCVENTRLLGVPAEIGSLFQPLNQGPFDCVILSHTLEHIENLKMAANWLHNALSKQDESYLFIEVPDATRYTEFVDSPFQDFNTEHINHFSPDSLNNFFKANGFERTKHGAKIISASVNKLYPSIYAFAKESKNQVDLTRDHIIEEKIKDYIAASSAILNEIDLEIRRTLAESPRIIVWGTGQLTMKLLVETSLSNAEIVAFVDSNPINRGKTLRGLPIISPEQVFEMHEPILISSTLHQKSITKQIQSMGLKNRLYLLKDE